MRTQKCAIFAPQAPLNKHQMTESQEPNSSLPKTYRTPSVWTSSVSPPQRLPSAKIERFPNLKKYVLFILACSFLMFLKYRSDKKTVEKLKPKQTKRIFSSSEIAQLLLTAAAAEDSPMTSKRSVCGRFWAVKNLALGSRTFDVYLTVLVEQR